MRLSAFKTLYSYRDLLFAWTTRTIRARYQQAVLGGLWAILQPVAMVLVFTVVFTRFITVDTGGIPYAVFSYSAMVPWLMFSASVNDMLDSLVVNMNLVSKIYFPREILPLAAQLSRLLDFGISSMVLLIMIVIYQLPLSPTGALFLPLILLIQLMLALGLGLIGSALNVFYRDVRHLFALGLQIWLYATPIIYPLKIVPKQFLVVYYLNPMVGVIESYRSILLRGGLPVPQLLISAGMAVVILAFGYWFFKRLEFQFADIV
jgi:lipopolysaccharide transport system permease protein